MRLSWLKSGLASQCLPAGDLRSLCNIRSPAGPPTRLVSVKLLDHFYGPLWVERGSRISSSSIICPARQFRWASAEETIEKPRPELSIDGGDADADDAGEPLRVVWSSD
jgi:hypothetical protein